jgi:hypothetical protein
VVAVDEGGGGAVVVAHVASHARAGRRRQLLAGQQAPRGRPEVLPQLGSMLGSLLWAILANNFRQKLATFLKNNILLIVFGAKN